MSPVSTIDFARNANNKSHHFGSRQGPLYNISFKLGLSFPFAPASNTTHIFLVEWFSLTTSLRGIYVTLLNMPGGFTSSIIPNLICSWKISS